MVRKPKNGAKEEGVKGALKGLGKGLLGLGKDLIETES